LQPAPAPACCSHPPPGGHPLPHTYRTWPVHRQCEATSAAAGAPSRRPRTPPPSPLTGPIAPKEAAGAAAARPPATAIHAGSEGPCTNCQHACFNVHQSINLERLLSDWPKPCRGRLQSRLGDVKSGLDSCVVMVLVFFFGTSGPGAADIAAPPALWAARQAPSNALLGAEPPDFCTHFQSLNSLLCILHLRAYITARAHAPHLNNSNICWLSA